MTVDVNRYRAEQSKITEDQLAIFDFDNPIYDDNLKFLFERWNEITDRLNRVVKKGAHILEVGCREGFGLQALQHDGFENLYGIDICETAISKASKKGLNCVYGDMHELPYDSNTFDAIIAYEVIEHSYNPNKALNEMWRVGKPGCILIAQVPIELSGEWHKTEHHFESGHLIFFPSPPIFYNFILQAFQLLDTWERYTYREIKW